MTFQTPNSHSLHLRLTSVDETIQFGNRLGHHLKGGEVLALHGDLGSGKTVLTRGIALGLGISHDQVSSPTFTLIQEYSGSVPLIHVDLYRIEKPSECSTLGLEEYFTAHTVVIIEWAERFPHILPDDRLEIVLNYGETENIRFVHISGTGPQSISVITKTRQEWESRPRSHP